MELEDTFDGLFSETDLASTIKPATDACLAGFASPDDPADITASAGLDHPAGLQVAFAALKQANQLFATSSLEGLKGDALADLLKGAEQLGRLTDCLKVLFAANIISREELPHQLGHKNHHTLLRHITRGSSKQVILLTRLAETFNRTLEQSRLVALSGGTGPHAKITDGQTTTDDLAPEITNTPDDPLTGLSGGLSGGHSVPVNPNVPGGRLISKFTAGEIDLESAALIADSVNKAAKIDDDLKTAGINPAGTDTTDVDCTDGGTNINGNVGLNDAAELNGGASLDLGSDTGFTDTIFGGILARGIEDKLVNLNTHTDQLRTHARNEIKTLELKHALDNKEQTKRRAAGRYFNFGQEENGLIPVHGKLLPEAASLLTTAFDAINNPHAKQVGFTSEGEADKYVGDQFVKRTAAQMRHDALETIVSFGLRNNETPILGGEAATLVVTTTLEDLKNLDGTATVTSPDGSPTVVDAGAARHAACVGSVLKVALNEGAIVAMHSLERNFTRKMRRAILARDGGCVIPECTVPANWCEIHHVVEHSKGGPTSIDNGVTLCKFHHRNLDSHGWVVGIKNGVPTVKRRENWPPGTKTRQNQTRRTETHQNKTRQTKTGQTKSQQSNLREKQAQQSRKGPPGNRPPKQTRHGTTMPKTRPEKRATK